MHARLRLQNEQYFGRPTSRCQALAVIIHGDSRRAIWFGFGECDRGVAVEVRKGPPFPQVVERPEVVRFQFGEGQLESKEAAEMASTRSLTRR